MLPTTDEIRKLGAQLVSEQLIVFPVRHHSPACAWQLARLLQTVSPAAVLVEGPSSFTPMIPLLVHNDAKMPLAVYTYAVNTPKNEEDAWRRAAYYPFCSHSPELVALSAAAARGIPTQFIDLDFSAQCLIEEGQVDTDARSLLDERHYQRSRYLSELAQQLGCRDHEELWEHLFEVSATSRSLQSHITDLAAYCHLARVECTTEELSKDGTIQREAEMAWHIQQALLARKANDGPVLVVIGGFHAVAMPALLASPVQRPVIARKTISDEASALIRYSYDRLDRLNGYSAGMSSPAWQQRVWEYTLKYEKVGVDTSSRARKEVALTILFDIASELRTRHGIALPMPTLVAAYEHALQLATLRCRPAPLRDDVLDAVTSCFIKGDADADGLLVLAVARQAFSGQALGKVPPGAGTPPLVKDFDYRARRQRLKIDDSQPRKLMLDIYRRPEHRQTSRLLHGLSLLAVPMAVRIAGPDFVNGLGLERLQEHWEYTYSAATEAGLVEASVWGVTVATAVANRFKAQLEQLEANGERREARSAAALLMQACVLGLHEDLPRVITNIREAINHDADFASVVAAASTIGILLGSREPLEAGDLTEIPALLHATYERAIYLVSGLAVGAGDANSLLKALAHLRELLVSTVGQSLDAELYWHAVSLLSQQHESALIRGGATGLLYSAGLISEAAVGVSLHGHLTGLKQPQDAISFLRGLLFTAREAAWQQSELLSILDKLLQELDEFSFIGLLPELRLAFAEMTPKETDRIAQAVAQLHGQQNFGPLITYDLSAHEVQANLAVSQQLAELLAADGLQGWLHS